MLNFENINYDYFGNCLKVSNEKMEMLITTDLGPRIISFHCPNMENIMCEDKAENSTMSGGRFTEVFGDRKWHLYGGHRMWFSPEDDPKSYYPDNDKVEVFIDGNKVKLTPPPQTETGFQFTMELEFDENSADVKISHTIKNIGEAKQEIAVWALTVTDCGGVSILPQCEKETGLLPNRTYTVWPYTDMQDDRLFWGNKNITIKQDKDCKSNLKIGFNNDNRWLGMLNKGQLFVKKFPYIEGEKYPDNGCNCECFTNFFMMEIESLSPLYTLSKGESITQVEDWTISPCSDNFDRRNEESVAEFVRKNIVK